MVSFIRSWFVLSKPIKRKKKKAQERKRKQVRGIIVYVGLAIIFGVVPMPVIWKWLSWFACYLGFIYIIFSYDLTNRLPRKTKILSVGILIVLFWLIFNSIALSMWMKEQARQTTGYLLPKYESYGDIKVEIGDSKTIFDWINPSIFSSEMPGFNTALDRVESKLKLRHENGKVLLTTDVHDRFGTLIVNIIDNEWTVSSSQAVAWETNYTNDSLEVKDRRGRVIFQVIFLPDRIKLQGEWWDEYGKGVRFVATPTEKGSEFVLMTPEYHPDEPRIEPIFEYPSDKHFGEKRGVSITFLQKIFLFRALGIK